MKKRVVLKKIRRGVKKLLTKQNFIILCLILMCVLLGIFLYNKTRRGQVDDVEVGKKEIEVQIQELEFLREESGYVSATEEEVEKQIEELAEIRKSRGAN